jgi:hypothetical protein
LNNSYVVGSAYIMLAALTLLQSSSHDMQFHHINKSSKASA